MTKIGIDPAPSYSSYNLYDFSHSITMGTHGLLKGLWKMGRSPHNTVANVAHN